MSYFQWNIRTFPTAYNLSEEFLSPETHYFKVKLFSNADSDIHSQGYTAETPVQCRIASIPSIVVV